MALRVQQFRPEAASFLYILYSLPTPSNSRANPLGFVPIDPGEFHPALFVKLHGPEWENEPPAWCCSRRFDDER